MLKTPESFQTTYQRSALRRLNIYMQRKGKTADLLSSLTPDNLMHWARAATGLDDFGSDHFEEPLAILLKDIQSNADYHFVGASMSKRYIQQMLEARLRIQQSMKEDPGMAREEISRPLIIVGFPRTGTTRLMHILAQDPAHRILRTWEAMMPAPPPVERKDRFDRRRLIGFASTAAIRTLAPEFRKLHPTGPDLPEECILLLAHSFDTSLLSVMDEAPNYQTWYLAQDHKIAYEEHLQQLQILQRRYRRERWLLKSPGHLFGIQELLRTYPDALIVQTHRDPAKVIPSIASLSTHVQGMKMTQIDPHYIGDQVLQQLEAGLQNFESFRPKIPKGQYLSVQYEDIVSNPLAVVTSIYETFGLAFSSDTQTAFEQEIANSPKDKHGKHTYSMEEFGFDRGSLEQKFANYVKAHNIPRE